MAFTEDLAPFFDAVFGFAVAATYDGATSVNVIFDNGYLEQLGIAGTRPSALGKATDFPAAAVGKTLLVNGTTYTIKGREPQDDGALVLLTLKA